MITLHHLENSRSQRILWLLEELGLPYRIVAYRRDPQTMLAPPALRAVHPLGKSPVIETEGQVLAESGAIIAHLVERAGRLAPPPGDPLRDRYQYWLHFAEGSMMPPLLLKLYFGRMGEAGAALLPRVQGQLDGLLAYVEAELGEAPWFLGEGLSAADIQMSFPLQAAAARGGLDSRYPRLQAWLARVEARPAYQRALAAGGPFGLLK
jgi:glutathione S-transferase